MRVQRQSLEKLWPKQTKYVLEAMSGWEQKSKKPKSYTRISKKYFVNV